MVSNLVQNNNDMEPAARLRAKIIEKCGSSSKQRPRTSGNLSTGQLRKNSSTTGTHPRGPPPGGGTTTCWSNNTTGGNSGDPNDINLLQSQNHHHHDPSPLVGG